jgi:hypothetical protein
VEILAEELKYLAGEDFDLDLDVTGFSTTEIDLLTNLQAPESSHDPADDIPPTRTKSITQPGDLWLLGEQKILCADARDGASYALLMADERARMVFADPPYNVPIDGHVCGRGMIKHREFAMACGEMTAAEYTGFLSTIFANSAQVSLDGALHYVCMDWRHITELMSAGKLYSELKNVCVWSKTNAGMGSLYRAQHELIFVFKVGSATHVNNIEWGVPADTAPISGSMRAPTSCAPDGSMIWRCIRQ